MTVKQMQCLLLYLGYCPGTVDGIPGKNTQGALTQFQRERGLKEDGILGTETERTLLEAVAQGKLREEPPGVEQAKTGTWWDEIRFFTREEFRCKCGGKFCNGFPAEPEEKLVRMLDRARAHFGAPGTVISGVRCSTHNQAVGGVENSRHKLGRAVDIAFQGASPAEMERWFRSDPDCNYCYQIRDGKGSLCGDVHSDVTV